MFDYAVPRSGPTLYIIFYNWVQDHLEVLDYTICDINNLWCWLHKFHCWCCCSKNKTWFINPSVQIKCKDILMSIQMCLPMIATVFPSSQLYSNASNYSCYFISIYVWLLLSFPIDSHPFILIHSQSFYFYFSFFFHLIQLEADKIKCIEKKCIKL